MKIIAFGHRRYTGKDTICKFIQRELRLKVKAITVDVVGFADQLKDTLHSLYSWIGVKSRQYYEDNPKEKESPILGLAAYTGCTSYRDLCIKFGNYLRQFDEAIWLNAVLKTNRCDVLLIKDMRFPIEFEAVYNQNGICNRIDRSSEVQHTDEADSALKDEDRWHNVYVNDGTLQDLHKIALKIVKEII